MALLMILAGGWITNAGFFFFFNNFMERLRRARGPEMSVIGFRDLCPGRRSSAGCCARRRFVWRLPPASAGFLLAQLVIPRASYLGDIGSIPLRVPSPPRSGASAGETICGRCGFPDLVFRGPFISAMPR
jgi:hypothetical protein